MAVYGAKDSARQIVIRLPTCTSPTSSRCYSSQKLSSLWRLSSCPGNFIHEWERSRTSEVTWKHHWRPLAFSLIHPKASQSPSWKWKRLKHDGGESEAWGFSADVCPAQKTVVQAVCEGEKYEGTLHVEGPLGLLGTFHIDLKNRD